jgi:hypothetical protein
MLPGFQEVRQNSTWSARLGRMQSFPFSSRTIGFLAEAIAAGYTGTTMEILFHKSDVDEWCPDAAPNKPARALTLLRSMRDDGSERACQQALELARLVLKHGKPSPRPWETMPSPASWWSELRLVLASDGWEFDTTADTFVPTVPGAQMPDEVSWLEVELTRRNWSTARGHYLQAVEAFGDGNWASANAMLRACFEEVMTTAGGTTSMSGLGKVQAAADALVAQGHVSNDECEFIKKLWKMLHAGGSHPGLSDVNESRFRLLALTGYMRFLLVRIP